MRPGAIELKLPDLVKASLQRFARDYGDITRKLTAKEYERIPHEHGDFEKDATALRAAIAGERPEFRSTIEAELTRVLEASSRVADVSNTRDEAKVRKALESLADEIDELNASFPEPLRAPAIHQPHLEFAVPTIRAVEQ